MMRKKWISSFYCCLLCVIASAQTAGYHFTANLDSVPASGYYNIALTPAIKSLMKIDYSDLRVVNDSGKWIAHTISTPFTETDVESVLFDVPFTIQEEKGHNTTVIITNKGTDVNQFSLRIKNTVAERFCALSGSDDEKNWFVINDSILLQPVTVNDATSGTIDIAFPSSNYHFFKLVIHNNQKDPINIRSINVPGKAVQPITQSYVINQVTTIAQHDSEKISYIKIDQPAAFPFNRIRIFISGSHFYSRRMEVYIPGDSLHSFAHPGNQLAVFTLSNNSTGIFDVPASKATSFYLQIHNEDNLPLHIDSVQTFSYYSFITTYLEKNQHYRLVMGNINAVAPRYDMQKNRAISDSAAFITTGIVTALPVLATAPEKHGTNSTFILWSVIIAVLIILLLFTQKMLKEVNQKKQDDHI